VYVRRLFILFLIGLAHALLHPLEILHRYAVLGLALLPLRTVSAQTLATVGVISLLAPPVLYGVAVGQSPPIAESAQMYSAAGLPELLRHNLTRFWRDALDIRVLAPLPYLVLGLYLGRRDRLLTLMTNGVRLARARWRLLGFGVGLQAAVPAMARPLVPTLLDLGSALVGIFYAAVIVGLLRHTRWQRRLSGVTSVSRMALTNYLLQTVVATTLLYGYGAGLHGRLGIVTGLPLAGLIFLMQVAASRWWIARFRFGSVEWLWRSATYGRLQPLHTDR